MISNSCGTQHSDQVSVIMELTAMIAEICGAQQSSLYLDRGIHFLVSFFLSFCQSSGGGGWGYLGWDFRA